MVYIGILLLFTYNYTHTQAQETDDKFAECTVDSINLNAEFCLCFWGCMTYSGQPLMSLFDNWEFAEELQPSRNDFIYL